MPRRLKTILRSTLGFLLAAVFLYVAFRGVSLRELWQSLQGLRYEWIGVFIVVSLLSHIVRAIRWRYFLAPIKIGISYRNLFAAVMVGYMINNILPRVGELVRPYALGRLENISKSSALGTVVLERIVDMGSFFAMICVVLLLYPSTLSVFGTAIASLRPLFLLGLVAVIGLFFWLFLKSESLFRLIRHLKPFLPKKIAGRADAVIESFLTGFRSSQAWGSFGMIGFLSVAIWLLYGLGLLVVFYAYDNLASLNLGLGEAMILLTVTSFAFILPAPGAFGTYHSFLMVAMIKLYSVDEVTALSYSLVTHEIGYILVMALGLYYFIRDHVTVSEIEAEATESLPAGK